ncbi:MAG: DmsE family decaheme c-type cytochrome [Vicinamibacterales bacterium]
MRDHIIALGILLLVGAAPAAAAQPGWSATDCQTCHEKAVGPTFAHTSHAGLEQSCATCHQNVAEHFKAQSSGEKGPVPSLKKVSAQDLNATCLTCHEKANQASYLSSMHARRNMACTTCHSIHSFNSQKAQLKTRNETDTCATCHKSERAKMIRASHHPVREGKMSCSSCHNPHDGVRPKMVKADSTNELCYTCHAEKRGPFLFEHNPVKEDCTSCHEPHGSNHNRMLAQKTPNLCWNCHLTGSGHFGSGDNFSTEKGVQVAPPGSPSGFPTVNSRFIERSCRTCHVKIHGSNHPSGAYFVR